MKKKSRGEAEGPVRFAVVGLGYIAQVAVLPAFQHAKNCRLVALVSGSREKLWELGQKYGVDALYGYDQYDELLRSGSIDAVYIALPNHLHCDYTVRAAKAGIHVLCEKPLAMTVADCEKMIRACKKNDVRLMTAYRLHFDEANLDVIDRIRRGEIGHPRFLLSSFSFPIQEENIRIDPRRGGGPVYDIGIYCINAARYLFMQEPIEVSAILTGVGERPKVSRVGETYAVTLRFPQGQVASFVCSFDAGDTAYYNVVGTEGEIRLDHAYDYTEEMEQEIILAKGIRRKRFRKHDQFAPELVYFSECVRMEREPEPSGVEGLADLRVIEAVFQSVQKGRAIALRPFRYVRHLGKEQAIHIESVRKPRLLQVEEPHKKAA